VVFNRGRGGRRDRHPSSKRSSGSAFEADAPAADDGDDLAREDIARDHGRARTDEQDDALDPHSDEDLDETEPDDRDAEDDGETIGPYDSNDAPKGSDRLDLGSLLVPMVEGVSMRFEADAEGQIAQLWLMKGDTALQLSACAAPRNEGLWDEMRDEIRASLARDGVKVTEVDGVYGPELRARVGAGGSSTELRVVGIDGPRWLVQAVYQGPGAVDPERLAPALVAALTGLVVNRGAQAMPVREGLPLQLPKDLHDAHVAEMAAQASESRANGVDSGRPGARRPVNGVAARPPGGRGSTPRGRQNS